MSNSCDRMDCSPIGSSVHGFSRQEHWSGLPFPSPGDLPNPGIEHRSPALQADSLLSEPPGKLHTTSWVALQCIKGKYYNFIKLFPYHLAYMHPKIFLKRNYKASGSVTSASFSQPYWVKPSKRLNPLGGQELMVILYGREKSTKCTMTVISTWQYENVPSIKYDHELLATQRI